MLKSKSHEGKNPPMLQLIEPIISFITSERNYEVKYVMRTADGPDARIIGWAA